MDSIGPVIFVLFIVLALPIAFAIWAMVSISSLKNKVRDLERSLSKLAARQSSPVHDPVVSSPVEATAPSSPAQPAVMAPAAPAVPVAQIPAQPPYAIHRPVVSVPPPRYADYRPAVVDPSQSPSPAGTPFTPRESTFAMPQGGTLFAFAGGLFVLIGALTFLGMAISRGWISHAGQVGLGVTAGIALMALGVLLARQRVGLAGAGALGPALGRVPGSTSGARNGAGLIIIGTGTGVVTLSAIVGVTRYAVLSPAEGLLLVLASAVAAVIAALSLDSQLLAGFGVVTALASPMLTEAPTDNFTLAAVAIALIATMVICVRRDWSWLSLVALAVTAPQLADWSWTFRVTSIIGTSRSLEALTLAVGGWWLLLVAAAFGFDLRRAGDRPRGSSAALVFLSSSVASGIVAFAERHHDTTAATWLACFGIAHLVIAAVALALAAKRPAARYVALLLVAVGAAVLAWSVGIALDGPGRVAFWSVEAVVLAGVHRRTGDRRALVAAGLATVLALVDGIFNQAGLRQLFESPQPSTITLLIALGAPLVAAIGVRFLTLRHVRHAAAAPGDDGSADAPQANSGWDSSRNVLVTADVIALITGTLLVASLAHHAFGDVGRTLGFIAGAAAGAVVTSRWPQSIRAIATTAVLAAALLDTLISAASPDGLAYGLDRPFAACADFAALVAGTFVVLRAATPGQVSSTARRVLIGVVALATLYLASLLVVTVFVTHAGDAARVGSTDAAQLALSTFWAIVALTTIVAGLSRRIELVHKAGAGLLTIAALKVLLVDTQQFGGPARVGAFIGVGLIMLLGGFIYLRASAAVSAEGGHPE